MCGLGGGGNQALPPGKNPKGTFSWPPYCPDLLAWFPMITVQTFSNDPELGILLQPPMNEPVLPDLITLGR